MYKSIYVTELDYKFKCIIPDTIMINRSEFDFLQIVTDDIKVRQYFSDGHATMID